MRLTAIGAPFDRAGWSAEPKLDGFRGHVYARAGAIVSRNANHLTRRFRELQPILERLAARDAILDGEIVAFVDGVPSFEALQGRRTPATFCAFDVLQLDGRPTLDLPLTARRALLADLIPRDDALLVRVRAFPSGVALFAEIDARQLEGVVLKRDASPYAPGARSRDWLKVKTAHGMRAEQRRQETWGH